MSETRLYEGKLTPISNSDDLEENCRLELEKLGHEGMFEDTFECELLGGYYQEYALGKDGKLYKILLEKETDSINFASFTRLCNGEVKFSAVFHNGVTCLSEVIENNLV